MDEIEKWAIASEILQYLPSNLAQFYDLDSLELLDEKIAVTDALKKGVPINEIPGFYDVLEKYPIDGTDEDGVTTRTLWV